MAEKRSPTEMSQASPAPEPLPSTATVEGGLGEWMRQAAERGVKPEQAIALVGMGLLGQWAEGMQAMPWIWNDAENGNGADLPALKLRLELVELALRTGAPLSTAEVSQLLGARPGAAQVERGGLRARRLGRNIWKLTRSGEESDRGTPSFSEGFRRRL